MNPVKKKNIKANAELKTVADYALMLEYINGYSKSECIKLAMESKGETLYERLLERNIQLFTTGDVVLQ
jgi:hypothetical protein